MDSGGTLRETPAPGSSLSRACSWVRTRAPRDPCLDVSGSDCDKLLPASASLLKPPLQTPPWVLLTTGRGEGLGKAHRGPRRPRAGRQPRWGDSGQNSAWLCVRALVRPAGHGGSPRPALQGPSPTIQPGRALAEHGCVSEQDFGLPAASPVQLRTHRT